MKCKDCEKDITGDEYKKVADWFFCLECFERLMKKSEKKTEAEQKPKPFQEDEKNKAQDESISCSVCRKEIEKGREKKLGIWSFCDICYGDLLYKSPEPVPEDQEKKEPEVVFEPVDRVSKVKCHGCGRQIFQAGANSYKGNPFCPDCFYSLPEEEREPWGTVKLPEEEISFTGETQSAGQNEFGTAEGLKCESCERTIQKGYLKITDGFNLCLACFTTDKELAVKIARDRHQKRLRRFRDEK